MKINITLFLLIVHLNLFSQIKFEKVVLNNKISPSHSKIPASQIYIRLGDFKIKKSHSGTLYLKNEKSTILLENRINWSYNNALGIEDRTLHTSIEYDTHEGRRTYVIDSMTEFPISINALKGRWRSYRTDTDKSENYLYVGNNNYTIYLQVIVSETDTLEKNKILSLINSIVFDPNAKNNVLELASFSIRKNNSGYRFDKYERSRFLFNQGIKKSKEQLVVQISTYPNYQNAQIIAKRKIYYWSSCPSSTTIDLKETTEKGITVKKGIYQCNPKLENRFVYQIVKQNKNNIVVIQTSSVKYPYFFKFSNVDIFADAIILDD